MDATSTLRELLRRRVAAGAPLSGPVPPGLTPLLRNLRLAAALAPWLPPDARGGRLGEHVADARERTASLLLELERVLPALEAADCRPVVLKGAALALAQYPEPTERWFVDLDLLVPRDRVDAACAALGGLGYGPARPDREESFYDPFHLHRVLIGPGRAVVEVHWDLTIPASVYALDPDGVRERARTVTLGRTPCRVAAPVDQVLHGVYQLVVDGFGDPRRVLDLAHLAEQLDATGWARVTELARTGRLHRALALWCEVAHELGGVRCPRSAADAGLGPRARRMLRTLDVAGGMLDFRARRVPGYARFVHLVLVPGWRTRLSEFVRLVVPGRFHLLDAGHEPDVLGGVYRRAVIGARNARNLSRILLRALGF